MLLEAKRKLILYDLNLKYPIENWTVEGQTNWLINKKMNAFEFQYKNSSERIFIIDYKDDLLSLICYKMLKNIQAICQFKFQIYILGKTFNTKKYLGKDKKISHLRTNILQKKKQCVVVQPVNPLYNVIDNRKRFKNFLCPTWKPLIDFTPEQIQTSQIFYHIGYLKKDKIQFNNEKIISFMKFLNGENDEWSKDYFLLYVNNLALVKLTGKIEEDQELLRKIEDYKGLVFYYYEEEKPQLLSDVNFLFSLQNWTNLPQGDSINNYTIPSYLKQEYGFHIDFFGNWEYDKRKYEILGEI